MATNFNTVVTSSASNSQITTEGDTSLITKGYFSTWTDAFSADTIAVASDSFAFIDSSDNNNVKRDTIANFVSAIAGSGLTASGGQLSATGGGTGTVTSVGTGTGLSGGPITTSGTINLDINGLTQSTTVPSSTSFFPYYAQGFTRRIRYEDFHKFEELSDLNSTAFSTLSTATTNQLFYWSYSLDQAGSAPWAVTNNLCTLNVREYTGQTSSNVSVRLSKDEIYFEGTQNNITVGLSTSGDDKFITWDLVDTGVHSNASAQEYGSATQVPVISVDKKGRITSVTETTISGGGGGGSSTADVSTNNTTLDLSNALGTYYTNSANTASGSTAYSIATSPAPVVGGFAYVRISTGASQTVFPGVVGTTNVRTGAPFAPGREFIMVVTATGRESESDDHIIEVMFLEP